MTEKETQTQTQTETQTETETEATKLTVYKSDFCAHSYMVEQLLRQHDISAEYVNIDRDPDARQVVMGLNNGYASVPTLVFADGTQMTEPSLRAVRQKLNIVTPGLAERVRGWLKR